MVAAELSTDKTMSEELRNKVDLHKDNQTVFQLPDRVTAKRFVFKLLYGGTAYGYTVDGDFLSVGFSQNEWQNVIDRFYTKYYGIAQWHKRLIYEAQSNGKLIIPSGRYYPITPDYSKRNPWPITVIKNYPVQGFGADLVKLARLRANQLLEESGLEDKAQLVCTIHDSIVADVDNAPEIVYTISKLLKQAVEEVPKLCKEIWGYDFALPLTCEIQVGPNKADMEEIKL